ncbi:MAG: beta-ketoacyl-[acyl-carrier-protein] synthase family protein [Planctomycetes bacterium]|nr:beta-ketoacyl-[acyl-carrier-protein] synthase family protein [Planctomycetota bacterium]
MSDRRVAVTGIGVVSPIGIGIETFWKALLGGAKSVGPITQFDASGFPCRIAAQLSDFSARDYVPKDYRKAVKVMARDIEIAVATAEMAFRDSGLATRSTDEQKMQIRPKRLGCNIGAGLICSDLNELGAAINTSLTDGEFDMKIWGKSGMNNLTPLWLLKYLPNMLSCHVTIIHGCEGPSNCITCGDASAPLAVGEAGRYITRDMADAAAAGGAESKLNPMGMVRQSMLGRLCITGDADPANACRPFDRRHAGTVIGEGGGVLIIEEMKPAAGRGAKIYAEMAGHGGSCDPAGIDVLKPNAGGLGQAVKNAMRNAGVGPEDVDLIVAHGTGVPGEDAAESAQWFEALGGSAGKIPAVALTGAIGSLFAGSCGVGMAAALMAMKDGVVPPTANFEKPADDCGLNLSGKTRQADIRCAVCASFTVGGQSGACVFKKVP